MKLISTNSISVFIFVCGVFIQFAESANIPCIPRSFGKSSIVCVCNATYCDTMEPLGEIQQGEYIHVISSKEGRRFETHTKPITFGDENFEKEQKVDANSEVRRSELWIERRLKYQKMIGWGGAFTDAAGMNMLTLTTNVQEKILSSYFGENGLEYNMARIPIGGADFSDRPYTLCDLESGADMELTNFALQRDDFEFKIPYIKQAQAIRPGLKLFASPWSAPTWMKSNGQFVGFSYLLPEFYQVWANYFIRFLEEYDKNGVQLWGLTPQNEPIHGLLIPGEWNSMGWTPNQQRNFIKNNLGPTLRNSKFNNTIVMIMDDQRFSVVEWSRAILGDPESAQYVDGIGLHWYANPYTPPFPLNVAHNEFPDYFMINTEACTGYLHFLPGIDPVIMGSWERAELYAHNIIEDLNHWLTGWVEWNLILDMTGGPNWAGNQVDAPIIVDRNVGEAYKQPMFYALGHFTKYVVENSIRISNSGKELRSLEVLSVLRPDNKVVLVVYNKGEQTIPLTIRDSQQDGSMMVNIGPRSINTIVYLADDSNPPIDTTKRDTNTNPPIDTTKRDTNTNPPIDTTKRDTNTNPPIDTTESAASISSIGHKIIPLLAIICIIEIL